MAKKKTYASDNFEVKEGLDGIRAKPTMYLGALGSAMLSRMLDEVRDNCFDEYMAGRNKVIEIVYNKDEDYIIVADQAGGIPIKATKLKSGKKISIMTAAFAMTHSSGKFSDGAYKASTGTHGIGVSAVNACSTHLQVWSAASGKGWHTQEFKCGEAVKPDPVKTKFPKDVEKLLVDSQKKYGTVVKFYPDHTVIAENADSKSRRSKKFKPVRAVLHSKEVVASLRDLVTLNPKLKVVYTLINKKKKKTVELLNSKSVVSVVKSQVEENEYGLVANKYVELSGPEYTVALTWTDSTSALFKSFVNSKRTIDHGKHVDGFKVALEKAIKPHATGKAATKGKRGGGKSKAVTYKRDDLLLGMFGYFDWKMHGAQFTSQIKDKLESNVSKEVEETLQAGLTEFFEKNKTLARAIIKRALEFQNQMTAVSKTMQSLTETRKKSRSLLPDVLSAATHPKKHKVEQFWVEGDSAGGTAKNGRNNTYQEVLKLGGKPINVINNPIHKVVANKVIQDLIVALGLNLKDLDEAVKKHKFADFKFNTEKLRTEYVMLMADADPDGYHIAMTLTAFFVRFVPDFIREGRLFIVDMPLYIGRYKGKLYGSNDIKEVLASMPKGATYQNITRAKGLGEMEKDEIAHFGMHPDTRKLIRVNYPETPEDLEWFYNVVGDSPAHRRELLGLEV